MRYQSQPRDKTGKFLSPKSLIQSNQNKSVDFLPTDLVKVIKENTNVNLGVMLYKEAQKLMREKGGTYLVEKIK